MPGILRAIFDFIVWVFTPGILVVAIQRIASIPARAADERHKTAMRAGFHAGFMLFIIVLIYQVSVFLRTGFPNLTLYQGFDMWLAFIGALAGFIVFFGGKHSLPPRVSGLIVLVLSFASFWSLTHYLLIRTWNEVLLSLILGITFGVLTHFATLPSSVREFLKF